MGGEGRGLFNDVQGFAFLPGEVLMGSGSGAVYLRKGADVQALTATNSLTGTSPTITLPAAGSYNFRVKAVDPALLPTFAESVYTYPAPGQTTTVTTNITVIQTLNGTITPGGTGGVVSVAPGGSQIFTITPSQNAFLAWGAFALIIAYTYRLRLMLVAGLAWLPAGAESGESGSPCRRQWRSASQRIRGRRFRAYCLR